MRVRSGAETAETESLPELSDAVRVPEAFGRRIAVIVHLGTGPEVLLLPPDSPRTIGRAAPSDLQLDDRSLSRVHARFLLSGDRVTVEDLGSTNGTWKAGQRIEKVQLELGDEVVLGALPTVLHALAASGESLGLEGDERFRSHLEEEAVRARQFRRPFALLVVHAARDAAQAKDKAPAAEPGEDWLERVRAALRPVDRLSAYGPDAAQVLLPETGLEEARRIAQAVAAPPPGGGPCLRVGVASFPDAAGTVDALLELARAAAHRATPERPVEVVSTAPWLDSEVESDGELVAGGALRGLLAMARQVADSRVPVILSGETGTGKEVLARFLHDHGPRKSRRMVRVNCAAIPATLVESTLFGHERGAFTGALHSQKGVFEEADGGTIFLDEIGELPPAAQAALLRVLETGTLSRVGSSREISVDVRVVAATHRDLEAMAAAGSFRADLYYRLNTVTLTLPPLRERMDEVEPLARRFLRHANEANRRAVQEIDPTALRLLCAYSWPGNVRELKNAIERAVVVTRGTVIGPEDLPVRILQAASGVRQAEPTPTQGSAHTPKQDEAGDVRGRVQHYEARLLLDALEAARWNRTEAAQRLGMPVRTLSNRMKALGLKKPGA